MIFGKVIFDQAKRIVPFYNIVYFSPSIVKHRLVYIYMYNLLSWVRGRSIFMPANSTQHMPCCSRFCKIHPMSCKTVMFISYDFHGTNLLQQQNISHLSGSFLILFKLLLPCVQEMRSLNNTIPPSDFEVYCLLHSYSFLKLTNLWWRDFNNILEDLEHLITVLWFCDLSHIDNLRAQNQKNIFDL